MKQAKTKLGLFLTLAIAAIVISGIAIAKPNMVEATNPGGKSVFIPEHAVEIAPNVFDIGSSVTPDGQIVDGIVVVHKVEANAKPGTVCGNDVCEQGENAKKCPADCAGGGDPGGDSTCYSFLASGTKWKAKEDWVVNPSNTRNLSEQHVFDKLTSSIQQWEDAGAGDVFGVGFVDYSVDSTDLIFGSNGRNEVIFWEGDDPNTIAVTTIWGIFKGKKGDRRILEWDQVYNQVDYDWGIGDPSKMDFENIASHEIGHAFGMGHTDAPECSEETMFPSATEGETKKRDLNAGDIAGVVDLYN